MRIHHVLQLAALAGLLFCEAALAAPSSIPITDVVLYPGGATITRSVQVRPGMNRIVIDDLPAFDMQSLHAEADNGVRVGEIESADVAGTHPINPQEARLQARITALQDQQDALDAQVKSSKMAMEYLDKLMSASLLAGYPRKDHDRPAPMLDPKTLVGLADAIRNTTGKSLAQMQALAVKKREIGKQIDALQRDLDRLRSAGTDKRTLVVHFTVQRAGLLRVSYVVNNASWRPTYRASLDSETSKVELERDAIISQQTGEDWRNVHLVLSTSQPRQATRGLEPRPWLLSWAEQIYNRVFNAPEAMEAAPALAVSDKGESLKKQAMVSPGAQPYVAPTVETQGAFANSYTVPARTTLASDGREVSVELTRNTLTVKQYFEVVPRQEAAAYVTAEADMPEGDWPAGGILLFRNGNYVGRGTWNPGDSEKLVLGFGRDDMIRVTVKPQKADASSSGIISKQRHKQIATLFSFVNLHKQQVTLKVLESSPVSTTDKVEVKTTFSPKPTHENWEDKRGVMEWQVKLAPKATAKIRTDYEIVYPDTGELVTGR